ncbi:MAG: type II 3-dehydroquinate dehydratase [Sneathiellaceae bacterium]
MAALIYVLNGPNLNLLGEREPGIYGTATLADVEALCHRTAGDLGLEVRFHQSNHEGVLIDLLHEAHGAAARGVVLNGAGLTHTSVPLLDAVRAISVPVIEVHLSNIHAREPWRHHTFPGQGAKGIIAGLGPMGYALAIQALAATAPAPPRSPDLRTA